MGRHVIVTGPLITGSHCAVSAMEPKRHGDFGSELVLRVVVEARVTARFGSLVLAIHRPYTAVLRRYAGLAAVVNLGPVSWVAKLRSLSDRDALYITVPKRFTKLLAKARGSEVEATITVIKA